MTVTRHVAAAADKKSEGIATQGLRTNKLVCDAAAAAAAPVAPAAASSPAAAVAPAWVWRDTTWRLVRWRGYCVRCSEGMRIGVANGCWRSSCALGDWLSSTIARRLAFCSSSSSSSSSRRRRGARCRQRRNDANEPLIRWSSKPADLCSLLALRGLAIDGSQRQQQQQWCSQPGIHATGAEAVRWRHGLPTTVRGGAGHGIRRQPFAPAVWAR